MSQVSSQLEGSTAILSLEGRTDLNLLWLELFQSLIDGLDEVAADANVTTVVLRGAGERAFSAGVDLHEMRDLTPRTAEEFIRTLHRAIRKVLTLPMPVIAAINGLKVALWPYLPFSCERLHGYLGYDTPITQDGWQFVRPAAGQALREPSPLFAKLDSSVIEEEEERLAS